jgi:radical SAM family uncharacterized protein
MENILKPARYIDSEWNSIHKEWKHDMLKVALCFPDIYEIGMSHLGMKILYGVLNNENDIICERVFSPWNDKEQQMRQKDEMIYCLESSHALNEFDIIGFSFQYEMNYTDVLNMLDLGNVPLLAKDRSDTDPLVIAGGSCVFNPEPMADFIDAFVIGEAEEAILEIARLVKSEKCEVKSNRGDILKQLGKIKGVYVPGLSVERGALSIERRIIKDLDSSYFPTNIVVPYIQIVHDRIGIEIMRGCPHKCRFCQACRIFHPLRLRSVKRIMEIAEESIKNTGYEEISLLSLSSGDYPHMEELIRRLEERFKALGVKVSMPSLRVVSFDEHNGMDTLKRAGLTFAPEAGSERLRHLLNKNIKDQEIVEKSRVALNSGWRKVKLYFMIGLPGETYEDLNAIMELVEKIKDFKPSRRGLLSNGVNLSITPFIPKPYSDFEREGMDDPESLKEKQRYLESRAKSQGPRGRIRMDFHSIEMSRIEAVLARGDRQTGKVILKAWQKGGRLQAWTEHFNYKIWEESFQETGLDPEFYLKKNDRDAVLPWGFISR